MPTLALLFGLMVVSAQFRQGGFYAWLTSRLALACAANLGSATILLIIGNLQNIYSSARFCIYPSPAG